MEKLCTGTSKTFLKMAGGRMQTPHSTAGHNLKKPSKESGIFQTLNTINFACFY